MRHESALRRILVRVYNSSENKTKNPPDRCIDRWIMTFSLPIKRIYMYNKIISIYIYIRNAD